MAIVLGTVYMCVLVGTTYIIYAYIHGASVLSIQISQGCLFEFENNHIWYALVVLIFCESLALGLLVAKLFQNAQSLKSVHRHSNRDLLTVIAHDGIEYFICNLVVTTINLIALKHLAPDLRDFLVVTQGALQNILCNRLLFHVYASSESKSYQLYTRSLPQMEMKVWVTTESQAH